MKKGFTLIELLVVVLIIGILAAIAVPQYQKAVLKANLHRGIPLVLGLYQAQQSYYLTNGKFAKDLDDLDITISIDTSCKKYSGSTYSEYSCPYGSFGISDGTSVRFNTNKNKITYRYFFKDFYISRFNLTFKSGKQYCWANPADTVSINVCENMGGTLIGTNPNVWKYYALD